MVIRSQVLIYYGYEAFMPSLSTLRNVSAFDSIHLLFNPVGGWDRIKSTDRSAASVLLGHTAILGLIPPGAALYGTTRVGWTVGYNDPVRLTMESALPISIIYYAVILVSILTLGKLIQWMNRTYGVNRALAQCVALAAYPATPLLLIGIVQLYPLLWLNYMLGLPALAYSIYLLYSGTERLMELPRERAFLMASSILAVCLISLVGVLAATVTLWGLGLGPGFVI